MLDNIIEHILGTPLQVSPLVMTLDGTTKGNAISYYIISHAYAIQHAVVILIVVTIAHVVVFVALTIKKAADVLALILVAAQDNKYSNAASVVMQIK